MTTKIVSLKNFPRNDEGLHSSPTHVELVRQVSELEFKDEYAIHRTREQYQKLLKPHFTFVSARVLESQHYFDEETTAFTDLLFRF